jgi:hypothetical protein
MRINNLLGVLLYCLHVYFLGDDLILLMIDGHFFCLFFPIVECDLLIRHYINSNNQTLNSPDLRRQA